MSTVESMLAQIKQAYDAGQRDKVEELLRRAVQKHPGDWRVLESYAGFLSHTGRHEPAVHYSERAVAAAPTNPLAHLRLGERLAAAGRIPDAIPHLRRAHAMVGGHPQMTMTLGRALFGAALYAEGVALAESAVAAHPTNPEFPLMLAAFQTQAGLANRACASVREIIRRRGFDLSMSGNVTLDANYADDLSAEELAKGHRLAGAALAAANPADPTPHANDPDPDRPLRVGYVSQDFHNRSAAHFMEPIFAHHDPAKVAFTLYSATFGLDDMTARLRARARDFVDISAMSDQDAARRVRADGIDVLVDLTGWTGFNRLTLMARRPAPVQATYLGYPNTTGLPAIGYRFVDALTDPPGSEPLATETLVRLDPCFLCYAPPPHAPAVSPGPSASGKPVTFGSFNTMAKIGPRTLAAWARVLVETPGSRMIVKNLALGDPGSADRLRRELGALGVDAARLDLRGETKSVADHLGTYAQVDIALDTFPYNGTTTTCEALWMGVPVITFRGDRHPARVSGSLLSAVGLADLVSGDVDGYVRTARALAEDASRRAELRAGLRERVRTSPLCDGAAFTRRLEDVYRTLWREWCAERRKG